MRREALCSGRFCQVHASEVTNTVVEQYSGCLREGGADPVGVAGVVVRGVCARVVSGVCATALWGVVWSRHVLSVGEQIW